MQLIWKLDHRLSQPAKIACHQCSGEYEKDIAAVASYCQTWIAGLLDTVIEILKCENISCAAERLTDGRLPRPQLVTVGTPGVRPRGDNNNINWKLN